jgi:hypothetical protein
MNEAFPHTRFSEILAERAEERARRQAKLPQDFQSLDDYHENKHVAKAEPLQATANRRQ